MSSPQRVNGLANHYEPQPIGSCSYSPKHALPLAPKLLPPDAQEVPVAATPLSAGASVGPTCVATQGEACAATCPSTIALGRARSPSCRGATSAGAGAGLTCNAIQCEACVATCPKKLSPTDAQEALVAAVPQVQVRAMACHALPFRRKPASQLAPINRHLTYKKPQ